MNARDWLGRLTMRGVGRAAAWGMIILTAAACQSTDDADNNTFGRPTEQPGTTQAGDTSPQRLMLPRGTDADAARTVLRTASTPAHLIWPGLGEGERNAVVADLRDFSEDAADELDLDFTFHESRYFLLATDLPEREAERWSALLDRMYALLLERFDMSPSENIWRGKALVLVFADADDYRRFQRQVHDTEPGNSIGMCHNFPNGNVHIAFYRSEDRRRFARVLVHESTHGFLHRYRSRASIASWINEGLAEWAAHTLVPDDDVARRVRERCRRILEQEPSLGDLFQAERIDSQQYSVAYTLTDYMIERSQPRYVAFIQSIKDGTPWREALEQTYGLTLEQLVAGYGRAIDVADLTVDP